MIKEMKFIMKFQNLKQRLRAEKKKQKKLMFQMLNE